MPGRIYSYIIENTSNSGLNIWSLFVSYHTRNLEVGGPGLVQRLEKPKERSL